MLSRSKKHSRNLVAPALKRLRSARGWSQQELAAKCQLCGWDTSREILARVENDLRFVTDHEVVFLAKVFKVSTDELLGLK